MDSLNNLNKLGDHAVGGMLPNDEIQSYAKRAERRMILEQVAMTVLAAGLFLAII